MAANRALRCAQPTSGVHQLVGAAEARHHEPVLLRAEGRRTRRDRTRMAQVGHQLKRGEGRHRGEPKGEAHEEDGPARRREAAHDGHADGREDERDEAVRGGVGEAQVAWGGGGHEGGGCRWGACAGGAGAGALGAGGMKAGARAWEGA
jgi:hypothetical protein